MGLLLLGGITLVFSGLASMYFGIKKILGMSCQKPAVYRLEYLPENSDPIECPYGIQAFEFDTNDLTFTSEIDD